MDLQTKVSVFRERFYGRQDVYGKLWVMQPKDGSPPVRGYAPVCDNLWADFCHIRLKSGVNCINCEHRRWTSVCDETVSKHIQGEEVHIYYVLQTDGTIRFGAMDFDLKEGREDKGYAFDSVMKVMTRLRELGIKAYIARSTGKGYHVYIFFDGFFPANKFRAFILELYDNVGFMQFMHQGVKPLPEFFPKQSHAGRDGIGNGIKPPMIDPQILKGRNCWVDDNDQVIEDQWGYFYNLELQSCAEFSRIIEELQIPILEEQTPSPSGSLIHSNYYTGSKGGKWQPPLSGSIEKVLEGCASLRKVRDKVLKGELIGHAEGFSLYHICMHTLDGLEWFKANVKGWGDNERDLKQLEHSLHKNYLPWTCRKLQENSVCPPGTQCFEKKPPREIIDGMEVIRDDIPKERWPEPSPIRYAHGRAEDYLLKLQAEVLEAKKEVDDAKRSLLLKEIARRLQVFDDGQQKEFKAFVRGEKLLKKNETAKIFNEAADSHEEDTKKAIRGRDDTYVSEDNFYQKEEFGYTLLKSANSKKKIRLCSFDINILEIKSYQEDGALQQTVYRGKARAQGIEKDFEITMDVWHDNTAFLVFFSKLLGEHFQPLRLNLELIRQAALGFSKKRGIERTVFLLTQGFYGGAYLMPSCIVDANGVRPNTAQPVDLTAKETRYLDFQILSEGDLREVLLHLKTEFLTTWPELWTYTGLAHTLLPTIMPVIDWAKKTTLFYEGLTGGGKSELTHALQFFWGKLEAIANFMSSPKGVRELGYQFKDACLVVDDFKGLNKEQVSSVRECILHAYDGNAGYKLNRNSEIRAPKAVRGVFMMSGEEFITSDAAVIARTILLETHKHNTQSTQQKFSSVRKHRHLYSGVTPQFISWLLRQPKEHIINQFDQTRGCLKEHYHGAQNIDRISNNLAVNYITWLMFTKFLVDTNTASQIEKDLMDSKHWGHIQGLRNSMVDRCAAEQSSDIFMKILAQLIAAKEVSIDNFPRHMHEYKSIVGFIPDDVPSCGAVYLLPEVVFEIVKNHSKNQSILGTRQALGRQFDDQGILAERDKGHFTKQAYYGGSKIRIWSIKLDALGLSPPAYSRSEGKVIDFCGPLATKAKKDLDGF